LLAALVAAFLVLPAVASAQEQAAPQPAEQEAVSVEQLEDLVSTLEDEAERQKLVQQLRALIEAKQAREAAVEPPEPQSLGGLLLASLSERLGLVGKQLAEAVGVLLNVPRFTAYVVQQAQNEVARQIWLEVITKIAIALGAGLAAEWVASRLLRRPRRTLEDRESDDLATHVALLTLRIVLVLVPVIAFAAVAYSALPLLEPRPVTRLVALAIINANALARAIKALARILVAPDAAAWRLIKVSDETAHYVFIWVRRLTNITVYGYFMAQAAFLLGLPLGAYTLLVEAIGLSVATMVVVLILQNRATVADRLRGEPAAARRGGTMQRLRNLFADIWHVLAIVYVVAIYGVWALQVEGGFQFLFSATVMTAIVLLLARLAAAGLRRVVARGFRLSDEVKRRFPGLEQRANRYTSFVQHALQGAVYMLAGLVLLEVWGIEALDWWVSEAGRRVSARLATILLIFVAAFVVWELTSLLVDRYFEERDATGERVERSARMRTLLPLLRNAVRVFLVLMVGLTALSELGVNIAPLLAGAGVVGLAIGFGAQTLVKDIITGIFNLIEDTIAVGDVVDLGGHAGVVEGMTIRTVRLRDLSGSVHTVPWGEVSGVLNMTKEFSFAVIDAGVAYREDVDQVIEVLKEIGAEMQADPEFGPLILEPLEVLGLDSFGDSAVNIRVRFKTRPIKQWAVRREFNRRMKRAFDARGIEIPFPHRTLYFGVDKAGQAPAAQVQVRPAADGGT
jgi:small conductance mechanosensitive channel